MSSLSVRQFFGGHVPAGLICISRCCFRQSSRRDDTPFHLGFLSAHGIVY